MLVALNAVNMADMADISLNEEIRVDIYIDCAIQLRSTLPWNLKFLAVSVQQSLQILLTYVCTVESCVPMHVVLTDDP